MMHNVSRHNGPSVHLYPRGAKRSIAVDRDAMNAPIPANDLPRALVATTSAMTREI